MSTQAGWYDDGSERHRYWDGTEWTEHFADTYAAAVASPVRSRGVRALWAAWTSRERWVAIGSVAGTVVGLLGLVVPLAFVDRAASVDTIAVTAVELEPVASELSARAAGLTADTYTYPTWAVPVDAPWAELFALHVCEVDSNWNFTARGEADTAAAKAWIERYGVPTMPHELLATITNTAGSGSITVSQIRPQGTLTPAPDRVWVRMGVCGGIGDCSEAINTRIALGADPVAVFGDPPTYDSCGSNDVSDIVAQAGDPVVFDVVPGQARPLYLEWTQTEDFSGRFVATVSSEGQSATIDLSPGNADITSLAVNEQATLLIAGYGEYIFGCDPDGNSEAGSPDNTITSCTLDQWLPMIGKG